MGRSWAFGCQLWPQVNPTIASSPQAAFVSVGGKPVRGKTLVVRNRDGLVAQIVQSGEGERSTDANADPASIALTPGDPDASIRFYRDILGFDLKTGELEAGRDVMHALGAEMGMVRRSQAYIPGTKVRFELDEYSGLPTKEPFTTQLDARCRDSAVGCARS